MGEGIPQKASFQRKRLRERLQCFASEKGKTGTEIASPILDKRILATIPARTRETTPAGGVFVNLTSVAPPS